MSAISSETGSRGKRVIVVGGGISGLAAAHRIVELTCKSERPVEVLLLEANDRIGGSIITHEREGFLIEGGPDSFITAKPWGLALCKRLGIEDELIQTNPAYRRTFVVFNGRMYPIPEGFLLLAPTRIWPFIWSRLFSWPGKLRMGMDFILPARRCGPDEDESLGSFVRRRFGRQALERVAQPLVGGIYTADPDKLSLRATMPRFLEMESAYGSIIRAMRKEGKAAKGRAGGDSGARYSMFVSFVRGMSTLIDTLVSRLSAGAVRTNASVTRVERDGTGWRVVLADGSSESADGVILASPAYSSAEMVRDLDGWLADEMRAIPYASSATMSLAFRRDQIAHCLDGFGFVVPAAENRSLIAVTYNSVKFADRAPEDWVLMRAFLGGALHRHVYEMDDDQLRKAVLQDLGDLIGVRGDPRFVELYRWPMSMPQYPVGHMGRVKAIESRLTNWPGLAVAGNAYGGVGIPDCIHSGQTAAEKVLASLADIMVHS